MERKNGETFEFEGKKLKVVENNDNSGCEKCFFCNRECSSIRDVRGFCSEELRTDKKHVIFVKAKDEQPQQAEQPQKTEEIKERKVGEVFEYEGHKLKVVADTDGRKCPKCFFYSQDCSLIRDITGYCLKEKRIDRKGVTFVEVKNEQPQEQTEQPHEEPQQLNLCEVLKHCPQGEPFWSPMFGDVTLYCTDQETKKVLVATEDDVNCVINADGTVTIYGVTSPEVMLYPSREQRDWSKVKYEPKNVLPRAWEELCQQNPITKLEYFIGESSKVRKATIDGAKREVEFDRNVLPSKQAAEAHLALMQLHQLRDAWREGWLPDWTEDNQRKYVICSLDGEFSIKIRYTNRHFLAFQDEKRAYEFKDYFIDLIRKAGDLI